jgi:hypothetical protein
MQLEIAMTGDRRLAENVILEVRALAHRYGLQMPSVRVMRQSSTSPKTETLKSRRRHKPRARPSPSV